LSTARKPNVLIIAGHDPSGGAGLHADIEAITQLGCHSASVITCLTLQDTSNAQAVWPIELDKIKQQIELLQKDVKFDAIKLGLLGTPEIANLIAELIAYYFKDTPLVIDPVLVASGGGDLALDTIIENYHTKLFPLATIVTPNAHEKIALTDSDDLNEQIHQLLTTGMQTLLLKGGDEKTTDVVNTLYSFDHKKLELKWTRFQGEFHGSGCTLASAIAAGLAKNLNVQDAVTEAQSYTWTAIKEAFQPGQGQHIPNRHYRL